MAYDPIINYYDKPGGPSVPGSDSGSGGGDEGGGSGGGAIDPIAIFSVSGTGKEVADSVEWDAFKDLANKYHGYFTLGDCDASDLGLAFVAADVSSSPDVYHGIMSEAKKFINNMSITSATAALGAMVKAGGNYQFTVYAMRNMMDEPLCVWPNLGNFDTPEEAIEAAKEHISKTPILKIAVFSKSLITAINGFSS